MRARLLLSYTRSSKHKARFQREKEKFNSAIKTEKSVDKIRFDHDRMEWDDTDDQVESLKIGKINVPHTEFRLMKDPTGK